MSNEQPQRDRHGRFLPNNKYASRGGKARAMKLSAKERKAIAAKGFQAVTDRYFNGDRNAAKKWLYETGLYVQDSDYRERGMGIFPDPGPHPAHKK